MKIIVLDLEWNNGSGYGSVKLNEILQIGAVRLDGTGKKFDGVFCAYIRPCVHKSYSPAAQELPTLELAKSADKTFPEVFREFYEWCGDDREFATWGLEDLRVLKQNVKYWEIDAEIPKTVIDLQKAFGITAGAASSVALYKAVDYCGFPTPFDFHNSLSDAVYTAVICESISREAIQKSVCPVAIRKKPRKTQHLGPFDTLDAMLNNRACRRAVCTKCGRMWRLSCWYAGKDQTFYSKFTCPQHGKKLLKLTFSVDDKKRLWAETDILDAAGETLQSYKEARKAGEFACKSAGSSRGGSRRRRRRRRSRSKGGNENAVQQDDM